MSADRSHPAKTALLVIDVQQGLFERAVPVYQAEQMLANINRLVAGAHRAGAPVIYIQHANDGFLASGSHAWQFHPQIQPTPADALIHKRHPNAFDDTTLQPTLQRLGVEALVVSGMVTHGCVRATCLGAVELGYRVTLAGDAHSNFHKKPVMMIQKVHAELAAAGVEIRPTADIHFD